MTQRTHQGRPVSVEWDSTPALYVAIFSDEYDGAIDSHHPVGLGRTEEEAVADLIEQDEEASLARQPRYAYSP